MTEFALELSAEAIVDRRSREHFREVLSSFVANNNSSAIVMLWTTVVCDLVFKLSDLRDEYADTTAKSILADIEAKQKRDPKSSVWETDLLESVWSRTQLLDNAEYTQLQHVHELRHLCAHPVLGSADILYKPNRDTTRACIRNAMEAVLLKPVAFTKGIVDALVLDLEAKRELLPDDEALSKYLNARYLAGRIAPQIENQIAFRLWILAFKAADPRADANRTINVRALGLVYQKNPAQLRAYVETNADKFSALGEGSRLKALIRFLGQHPLLYDPLTAAAKVLIQQFAVEDVESLMAAWFLDATPTEHVAVVKGRLRDDREAETTFFEKRPEPTGEAWRRFVDSAATAGVLQDALRCGIEMYVNSWSYDQADARFDLYIEPYLAQFDAESLRELAAGIEENAQTWGRRAARRDHQKIRGRWRAVMGAELDVAQYPHLTEIVE